MSKAAFAVPCHVVLSRHAPPRTSGHSRCLQQRHVTRCELQGRTPERAPDRAPKRVEDGVTLPRPLDASALQAECTWLSASLTDWLETEWRQSEPQEIHTAIGKRSAGIYERLRNEGEDDLASVMIAIGSELEDMDLSQAFVGAWNVANRAAELLLERCVGGEVGGRVEGGESGGERRRWEEEVERMLKGEGVAGGEEREYEATAVVLKDTFDKLQFLKNVLEGAASKAMIDGAVAEAAGFRYDGASGKWDGAGVKDEHFRVFGNEVPDVLGDESVEVMTETLSYMEEQLWRDTEDEVELRASLEMLVETLHGVEMTRIQREDAGDHGFRKRAVVVKWLHVVGEYLVNFE